MRLGPAAALAGVLAVSAAAAGCGGGARARDPALATEAPPRTATREHAPSPAEARAEPSPVGPVAAPAGGVSTTDIDAPPPPPPPDERPALEVLEGRASYYADRFHGRPTASGEPYDMHALTAASRDLPFGTIVRVVRVETGASVVVRVNDRGPFRDHARILDLSRAAAEALDMVRAGVVDVRAEILERGEGRRWRPTE